MHDRLPNALGMWCGDDDSRCFAFLDRIEFNIWQQQLPRAMVVSNLGDVTLEARASAIKRWYHNGGVLLVSDKTFANVASKRELHAYLQPDVLILDEAHTMLKNPKNKVYKALLAVTTPRKIGKCKDRSILGL